MQWEDCIPVFILDTTNVLLKNAFTSTFYHLYEEMKMNDVRIPKLMLHCGAAHAERQELGQVPLPQATKTYQPFGHEPFLNLVEDKMQDVGFRFGAQEHSLTRDGKRYFGLVQLLNGGSSDQHALVMGLRNSYDKAFAASVSFGAHVFVCDNLSFTGEVVVGRKHTVNIERDLPGLVVSCVSQTKVMAHVQDQRFESYQDRKLDDAKADRLIIDFLRRGVINTSRVEKVVNEWYEPETDHGPKRVWRLFNAVTESLKGSPLHDMPRRTIELQAMCDEQSNFKPEFRMAA